MNARHDFPETQASAEGRSSSQGLSRRDFLKAGGGLVLAFSLAPETALTQARPPLPGSLNTNRILDAWLRIGADGRVTILTGKIELGQGIGTALSQIAADELDVDIGRIDMVYGDTGRSPDEGQTAGSQSIEQSGTALRFACAEARSMLVAAAAARLGVDAGALKVDDGKVFSGTGASATYWELAAGMNFKREASGKVPPKNPAEYKWVGKSISRRDIPNKFTGGAAYVQDVRLPNMLHGRVVRPPSPGARLVGFDEAAARKLPGVVAVVRDGNFIAVAAEREEQAIAAREALRQSARWQESETLPPPGDALFAHMMKLPSRDQVVNEKKAAAPLKAAKSLEATYTRPYQAHGSIGPSCALAQWQEGKLTVWTHSQGVFPLRGDLSRAFRMDAANIRCIHAEGSGCYGHNSADDVAFDAAMLARSCGGRPVRVQLMRDDEFAWEPFGSAMAMKLSGKLDDQGNVIDWQHELWSHPHNARPGSPDGVNLLGAWLLATPAKAPYPNDPPQPSGGSDRNSIPLYEFPSQKITKHYLPEMPIRTSALRTLGGYANVFALESFMDELATAAGADPVAFRLKHLKDPRARAVIELAAERAGWTPGARGDGERGRGFAFAKYKNLACYCAVVVDLELNRRTGAIKLARAVAAVDAGLIVNPDGLRNQIEGGIIQSASWTLLESVRHDRTRVATRTWADYPILRFEDIPPVQVHLIDRPTERSLGVGEGSQGPTVAAIANALAHTTGRRLRALPFTPEKVLAGIKA